ncbi:MAG: permease, major facilitator superfamily [Chlamydiales bacterium]|jgi:FSR family fosmidomycin resistance protein-like MFS transporter|nr:permease, major facilitator superfamily [Chlamydiales bacterium]
METSPSGQRHVAQTLAILWLGHFVIDFMIGSFSIYKTIAHIDLATAGLIAGCAALVGEGGQLFFGPYGDRGWRKVFITISFILASGSLLLSYAESELAVFFCFMATCIGSGAFHPSAAAMVGNIAEKRSGLYFALFASGGTLGMALSHLFYTKAHTALNGQMLWLAPFLLLLVLLSLLLKEKRIAQPVQEGPKVNQLKECWQNRSLRSLYFSLICNQTVFWTILFLLPDFLLSRSYPEWVCYGGGHLVTIIGAFAMLLPIGYLTDIYSPKTVKATLLSVGFFVLYAILALPRLSEEALLPLLFALGACIGAFNPVGLAWGNQLLPKKSGSVNALLMGSVWMVSECLGPSLSGLLSTCFASDAPGKTLMVFGMGLIGSLYFVMITPNPHLAEHTPSSSY